VMYRCRDVWFVTDCRQSGVPANVISTVMVIETHLLLIMFSYQKRLVVIFL
jgi:hypothetical protein